MTGVWNFKGWVRSRQLADRGFTLPELLVTTGLFVLLAIGAVGLLSPKQFAAEERNAQRRQDLAQLMQALTRYEQTLGHLPADIPTREKTIGSLKGQVNLCSELVPTYLKDVPLDPLAGGRANGNNCAVPQAQYSSGYTISKTTHNHFRLAAPAAEKGLSLSLSR